ncbi:hypothetical protein [Thermococcus sp.]
MSLSEEKTENISRELMAWRELEGLVSNQSERPSVYNITTNLERSLELRREGKLCNFTLAAVEVSYPKPSSNVPLMILLWADSGSLAIVGVLRSDSRDKKLTFEALVVLAVIFIGAYAHDQWISWNSERGISEILALNGSNVTLEDSSNFVVLHVTLDSTEKAEMLANLLREFNVSVSVRKDGPRGFRLDGMLPLNELEVFKNASKDIGTFYLHSESHIYQEFIAEYERENEIIRAYLDDLSPESRGVMTEILRENREAIESLRRAMEDRAQLTVFVSLPYITTPEAYHDLSVKLTFLGLFFGLGCLLVGVVWEGRNR